MSRADGADEVVLPVKRTEGETLAERLTDNAYENILPARYLRKDSDGDLVEDQEDLFPRVAKNVALAEAVYEAERRGVEVTVTPDQLKPDHPRRDELAAEVFGEGTAVGDDAETALTERNVNKFAYDTVVPELPDEVREHVESVEAEFRELMERLSFIPNCVPPDSLVAANGGLKPLTEIDPGERVYDDEDGYANVQEKYENGEKLVLEIETASGYSVRATPEHYFRVITEDGEYEWRQVKDIEPGHTVALQKNFLDDEGEPSLLEAGAVAADGGSLTSAPTTTNSGRPRSAFETPDAMTPDLAEWLGLYIGDGTARESGVRVAFDDVDEDLVQHWVALTESVFGFEPTTRTRTDAACIIGQAFRRDLYDFIERNDLLKETSETATVPDAVLRSGRTCIASFLGGLFEADGTVNDRSIELYTHSELLASQVQKLLLGLGIRSKVTEKRDGYRVTIRKNVCGRRFVERVGFVSERKSIEATRFVEVSDNATSVEVPNQTERLHEWFQESDLGLDAYRDLSQFLIDSDSEHHQEIGKEIFGTYAEKYPELKESPVAEHVERDQIYESVSTITEMGTMAVEDMQVPRRNTYVVEGFVSHNSPTLMNAGDELQQLSACFVDSPEDDLTDIHNTASEAAEVFQCLTDDARVHVAGEGVVSVADVEPGDVVHQRDGSGHVEETHAYDDAPVHRVTTPAGIELTGTPNHELLVDGEWTRIDEIDHGDTLTVRLGWLPDEDETDSLESVDAGGQWAENRTVTNEAIAELHAAGLSDYEIADRLDCGSSTVQRRRANELGLDPNGTGGRPKGSVSFDTDHFDSLYEDGHSDGEIAAELGVSAAAVGQHRATQSLTPNGTPVKSVTQPTELTPDLAELLGMWVGDGSKHQDGIRFHLRREETLEHADRLCRHLFDEGLDWRFEDGCYDAVLHSHEIKRFWLRNFGDAKPDAPNASVPDQVWRADHETVAAFLRGLFSADGSLQKGTHPRLWSASETLVDDVQQLLVGIGIPAVVWTLDDDDRDYYNVGATGEIGLTRFAEEVGFVDVRRERMRELLAETDRGGTTFGTVRDGETWELPVESVEDAGTATVYDVTVAGDHEYLADGVVSHNSGGGMGYAFWRLRPYGDPVGSTGGIASGPITFMETYDQLCETIAQGGTRRGAQMAIMRVSHPDVVEFVHAKNKDVSLAHALRLNDPDDYTYTSFSEALEEARGLIDDEGRVPEHLRNAVEGHLSNFNISVGVTDDFMDALGAGEEYTFLNPRTGDPHVATEATKEMYARYDLDEHVEVGEPLSMPAEVLWERIVAGAHENGEPGVVYLDRINDEHSFPVESTPTGDGSEYEILATNPCVAEGTLVNTPDGYRRVEEVEVGDEISTVVGSETVDEIEVHDDYPVHRVEFSDGGTLDVTAQHRFHVLGEGKQVEKIPLHEVEEGDHVRLHPAELADPGTDEQYERELKRGILLGDGCYSERTVDRDQVAIATSVEDEGYNERVKALFGEECFRSDDPHSEGKAKKMVLSDGGAVVQQLDLDPAKSPGKSFDPTDLTTEAEVMGVLDGLLATDGNVNLYSNHPQIRWDTSSEDLARAIREALLAVGIHGRISVVEDPKRGGSINGRKVSANNPKYTVNVSGASARRYAEKSRLDEIHPEKGEQLFELRTEWMTTGNTWKAQVESIEPLDETTTVYDLYCSESDTWITEGYVQQGCGEQPLMEYEACNLGHVNLSTLAARDGPDWRVWSERHGDEYDDLAARVEAFIEEAVDVEEFDRRVESGTRFLENVVTMSDFPVEEIEETVSRNRKVGLGIMGLAQLYVQLGLRYGSEPANEVARQLMVRINHGSKWTSHELAEERGSFANWADSKYADPTEYREWFEHQTGLSADDWADGFPIRNHNTTTIAPTGTTSMIGNTSGGCEPIPNVAYYKNVSDDVQGEEMLVEFDDYFLRTLEANGLDVEAVQKEAKRQMADNEYAGIEGLATVPNAIGELFVVTADLTGMDHAEVQVACQEGVDSAISKTINAPNEADLEDTDEAFRYIWREGGKGVTYYRDGTRSKQVITTRAQNVDYADMDEAETVETLLERVEEVLGGLDEFLEHEAVQAELEEVLGDVFVGGAYARERPRPDVLHGVTQRIQTGYGKMYVNINEDPETGEPFELFITIGNSGGFTNAFTDALAKVISYALRSGVDPYEIAEDLQGIRSPKVAWDKGEQINSIPDAVGVALRRYLDDEIDKHYPQQKTLEETAEGDEPPLEGGAVERGDAERRSDGGADAGPPDAVDAGAVDVDAGVAPEEAGAGVADADAGAEGGSAADQQAIIDAGESPECPECGAMALHYSEGCKTCESCGWSEC